MKHYKYDGPVTSISGQCTTPNWSADTYANSKTKAINNIKYQYKKKYGIVQGTKLLFPNDVVEI